MDMARLAEVRARREAAAKRREQEELGASVFPPPARLSRRCCFAPMTCRVALWPWGVVCEPHARLCDVDTRMLQLVSKRQPLTRGAAARVVGVGVGVASRDWCLVSTLGSAHACCSRTTGVGLMCVRTVFSHYEKYIHW